MASPDENIDRRDDDPVVSRSKKDIESYLSTRLSKSVKLRINQNRSTFLSMRSGRDGSVSVSLHESFLQAEDSTMENLTAFLTKGGVKYRNRLRDFVQAHKSTSPATPRKKKYSVSGVHYNLERMSEKLNSIYFDKSLEFTIGWYDRPSILRRRVKQMILGKCYFAERLILIHPILDQKEALPRFVEFVVYHELCHLAVAPKLSQGGRMLAHTPEFRHLEKQFAGFREIKKYEEKKFPSLMKKWHHQKPGAWEQRAIEFVQGSGSSPAQETKTSNAEAEQDTGRDHSQLWLF